MKLNHFSKFLMELIGTFSLCFFGGWSVILSQYKTQNNLNSSLSISGVSLVHTMILTIFIYLGAKISGGQYNPALSLTLLITKFITFKDFIIVFFGQIFGSLIAGFTLRITTMYFIHNHEIFLGYPKFNNNINLCNIFIMESISTFFLVLAVLTLAIDNKRAPNSVFGISIGSTVGISVLAIGKYTGAALNPARVLGPEIFSNKLNKEIILYSFAPIIGSLIAGFVFKFLLYDENFEKEIFNKNLELIEKEQKA